MLKKNLFNNKSITLKVLVIPIILMSIVIALISGITIKVCKNKLLLETKLEGINLAKQISSILGNNENFRVGLNHVLDKRAITIGEFIKGNEIINNDYIKYLCNVFDVDEINVTDPTGKVIFSNLDHCIGRSYDNSYPVAMTVLKGNQKSASEPIRKSNETSKFYKYAYIKKNDGGIIQVGLLADKVKKLIDNQDINGLMDKLIKEDYLEYALFINNDLKIVADSDRNRIGNIIKDESTRDSVLNHSIQVHNRKYNDKVDVYDIIVPVDLNGKNIGVVNVGISKERINRSVTQVTSMIIIVSIIFLILIAFVMIILAKNIITPVKDLVDVSKKVSEGNFDVEIISHSDDEIGLLANSFKEMCDNIKSTVGTIKSEGLKIDDMSEDLKENSNKMTSVTSEVALAVQDIAEGSSDQTNALNDIVSYMNNLSDEIQNIYDKISNVKESSNETEHKAIIGKGEINTLSKSIENVKKAFDEVVIKVNGLSNSVSQIGNITDVINSISEQTNLLALNAAIEAARAGEAGRGFAVVADEVRKLAEQSKESTIKIQNLVHNIKDETENVIGTSNDVKGLVDNQTDIAKNTMTSFIDMLRAISNIAPLVEDVYNSIESTLESKDVVFKKTKEVLLVSEKTAAASEEIAASAEEMTASSSELSNFVSELNSVVENLNKETNKFNL